MATTLVRRAKLLRPRAAPDLIARPRLLDRLNAGLTRPLTLLSTPAGCGKTTLLGQWLDAAPLPSAWLALDAHDSALPSFVAALVGALQTFWPEAGRATLGLLHLPVTPDPAYLGAALADELLDLPGPALLVLDDYHAVADPAAHAFVAALLEYPPPSLRLALATRVEPPLPLARLRARDRVTELRGRDLAFTTDEAAAFLARAAGSEIDPAAATLVEQRTEGWAVGLRLAALALQGEGGAGWVAAAFAGRRQRQAMDFLLDEVLLRQPPAVQAFLLRTSVVAQVCGPLAEALLDPTPEAGAGEAMLWRLVDANLFVTVLEPGEDGLEWARYHPLFRELLQERLGRAAGPAAVADLHRRAADWLAGRGLVDEALEALLAGGEPDEAARLVEGRVAAVLDREDWPTLWRWLRRLPEELTARRPGLLLAHALIDQLRGRGASMAARLAAATALLDAGDRAAAPTLRAQADVVASALCCTLGDGAGAVAAGRRALPAFPDPHSYLGGAARCTIGMGLYQLGRRDEALRALGATADHAAARLAPQELFGLASVEFLAGDLRAARRWVELLLAMVARRDLPLLTGWAHYKLGWIAYEVDALDEARARFAAVAAERHRHSFPVVIEALLGLALTEQAQGRPGQSEWLLGELDDLLAETGNDEARPVVQACQARLALQRGDRAAAVRWLEAGAPGVGEAPMVMEYAEFSGLTRARLLLARGAPGDLAAADALLAAARARAEREHLTGGAIQALAGQALARAAAGDEAAALDRLAAALDLAEPGGFVRTFLDLGPPLTALLRELAARRPPSPYLAHLLTAAGPTSQAEPAPAPSAAPLGSDATVARVGLERSRPATRPPAFASSPRDPAPALVEALTTREVQVLERLAHHLSNKEIAAELNISPLTVKRHVGNLCGKLGAGTRRQAVAIAASLGLVPPRLP
jgi:LuxR family maltose regulon positive regulatory protein